MNDVSVYQRLSLIFVAVSVIELIFVPRCMVCAASQLKGVVINLASTDVPLLS